jgi:hypothetical protein
MSSVLAIDPGTDRSAWLILRDGCVEAFAHPSNDDLLDPIRMRILGDFDAVVIEQIESFGMAVGREVFETVRWAGRFEEAAHPIPVVLLPRRRVKLHLCGSAKAKDPNIRQALIDRFGGPASIRKGGALYGISKDVWSALAIAITYSDGLA